MKKIFEQLLTVEVLKKINVVSFVISLLLVVTFFILKDGNYGYIILVLFFISYGIYGLSIGIKNRKIRIAKEGKKPKRQIISIIEILLGGGMILAAIFFSLLMLTDLI